MKHLLYILLSLLMPTSLVAQYQFLGSYDSEGAPVYLVGRDEVSAVLQQDITSSLPESHPVPQYNPHYISSGYDTDILLLDSAAVFVTFLGEGTGYRNVLGFYTYEIGTSNISKPSTKEMTIIFPNISATGSGGGLKAGDKVKIGDFSANTGIGWVLIADGWDSESSKVTNGNWILYSNPDFNPEHLASERLHNVLLNDAENGKVILGFEDVRRDQAACDQDFNDVLFDVTVSSCVTVAKENNTETNRSVNSGNGRVPESNGSLSVKIAERNFARSKSGRHAVVRQNKHTLAQSRGKDSMLDYLPQTGITVKEYAIVSSSDDLMQLTNADEIFAVDYNLDVLRIATARSISTVGDQITIELQEPATNVMVNIYDTAGKMIFKKSMKTNYGQNIDLRIVFPSGYYLIEVQQNGNSFWKRLLIKK